MRRLYSLSFLLIFGILAVVAPNASASVDDFKFSSFNADYYLSKDSEGRAELEVVETLTAEFPNFNQNKGIVRYVPDYYDGHPTSFELVSLTRNGLAENVYNQAHEGDFTAISTGSDTYVYGTQVYVLTYKLRDVVIDFGDHQEFYWDVNGTGWSQSFDKVTARVYLDSNVANSETGDVSCYQGAQNSNTKCDTSSKDGVYAFSSTSTLSARQNITLNMVFDKGTFKGYPITFYDYLSYVLLALYILAAFGLMYIKLKYGRDNKGRGTIVTEYLPPKDVSVYQAAEIYKKTPKVFTAQIIDLAVRHKVRILIKETKVLFATTKDYSLELLSVDGLSSNETDFLIILFGSLNVGSVYEFSKSDSKRSLLLTDFVRSVRKSSVEQGYRSFNKKAFAVQIGLFLAMALISGSYVLMGREISGGMSKAQTWTVALSVFTVLYGLLIYQIRPLTQKGRELKDYLLGLKSYIKLAEEDRIKFLQSPDGAEKRDIKTDDSKQMVVLYEKVLPYAVLFGVEKKWASQLAVYYQNTNTVPIWYVGGANFNVDDFTNSLSSFSNYSSSSYSSTSGAGGGGFSGGGGGGGGGGGR